MSETLKLDGEIREALRETNAISDALRELRARMEGFKHYGRGWTDENQRDAEVALGRVVDTLGFLRAELSRRAEPVEEAVRLQATKDTGVRHVPVEEYLAGGAA